MPLWSSTAVVKALQTGIPITVINAETLSNNDESIAVGVPNGRGREVNITFTVVFGSAPASCDYVLQTALDNVDAEFFDVVGSNMTATAGGKITVNGIVAGLVRVKAVTAGAVVATVKVMIS